MIIAETAFPYNNMGTLLNNGYLTQLVIQER